MYTPLVVCVRRLKASRYLLTKLTPGRGKRTAEAALSFAVIRRLFTCLFVVFMARFERELCRLFSRAVMFNAPIYFSFFFKLL